MGAFAAVQIPCLYQGLIMNSFRTTLKPWCVGIYRGNQKPGFLSWGEMGSSTVGFRQATMNQVRQVGGLDRWFGK